MAREAGLLPAGNWKWALRNLRDHRGNLFQGRELAEAKEGLGKLPNNVRQQVDSVARRAGFSREINTVHKNDPAFTKEMLQHVPTNEIKEYHSIGHARDWNDNGVTMTVGTKDSTIQAPVHFNDKSVLNDIHTHPQPGMKQRLWSDPSRERIEKNIDLNLRRTSWGEYEGDLTNLSPRDQETKKKLLAFQKEVGRTGRGGTELVSPSGYSNALEKRPSKANSFSEGGDYGVHLQKAERNPNVKMTILDPVKGYEGTHTLRPDFVRSVYFKNHGQY
jgi:hypothetical protein